MPMTPDAKRELSTTIRSLRSSLLDDLHAATDAAYRLGVRARDAGLDDAARKRRVRLETWVAEQIRAQVVDKTNDEEARTAQDFRREAEKQAAYTLLNRLVVLRLMEAPGPNGEPLRASAVVTGGWESRAYKDFRQIAPALMRGDETEGFAFLLQLVFEDLATELPGIYGSVGIAELIPIPAATLRHVVEELDKPELKSCWTDDMTLGWIYQYWNDPEREAIDAKLNAGGQLQSHEIASKTQLFTERYMVDWLLQNSLGPMWLAMCRKRGWTPELEARQVDGKSTLQRLEERRAEWRTKRATGAASRMELMPLDTEAERHWAYYVPQAISEDTVTHAPESVRDLKILDPAVGSGHFLVVAMDLLVALYREEARHRGQAGQPEWNDRAIVECILSQNLNGIDLDPRAVQIAAAALWLKARRIAPDARPKSLNLVSSNLRLASLPEDDPALSELRVEVERETGIPGELTDAIVHALRGADFLGSLLKVDHAVDQAIDAHEQAVSVKLQPQQAGIFGADATEQCQQGVAFEAAAARRSLLGRLETFLTRHTSAEDLGLRLHGEQLAAGVRFVRMVRENSYNLVVANPPYQGTSKMVDARYIQAHYPLGRADLYAAFLLRGLELARYGGVSSMLTIRNWMFTRQYAKLREHLLETRRLQGLGDLDWGAFREMKDVKVTISHFQALPPADTKSIVIAPTGTKPSGRTQDDFEAKNAGLLLGVERYEFDPSTLKVVPQWPLVYWWQEEQLKQYRENPLIGDANLVAPGVKTGDDTRFLRYWFEVSPSNVTNSHTAPEPFRPWQFYIKGAAGAEWVEPGQQIISWRHGAVELGVFGMYCAPGTVRLRDSRLYFRRGIAFCPIGSSFSARVHRFPSIFGNMGSSVFPSRIPQLLCLMNSSRARLTLESLNPGVHFEIGDVCRLPMTTIARADEIVDTVERAFGEQESHREPSIEFRRPGGSPWRHAKEWAQTAVDRPEGAPLPPYEPECDDGSPTEHVSFVLGVVLGRFDPDGQGVLDPCKDDLTHALPDGILFLDGTLDDDDTRDSLGHHATAPLHGAWAKVGAAINTHRGSLRQWLAVDFFKDVHKGMYENRPIHWPLSSQQKTFVAWVNIHRLSDRTLHLLLADHLQPAQRRLDGQLHDLRVARNGADKKAARRAEKQYDRVLKAEEELQAFIVEVEQCADRGAAPTDPSCPGRLEDARYSPDLDDGVMINSAALWPLLEPQWKDPKKWWKELSLAKGKKDYDWSHLAMCYWPTRVDAKCQEDPSLAVAHDCFWRYHPERAWAWELRLQDAIGPDFRIQEVPYCPGGRDIGDEGSGLHREAWLRDHAQEALAAVENEAVRRLRRYSRKRELLSEMAILEEGLWSAVPDDVWEMELRLAEKQGAEFRLLAPDEPLARGAYETAHPDRVQSRVEFIATLVPPDDWFGETSDEDEDAFGSDNETDEDSDLSADVGESS